MILRPLIPLLRGCKGISAEERNSISEEVSVVKIIDLPLIATIDVGCVIGELCCVPMASSLLSRFVLPFLLLSG